MSERREWQPIIERARDLARTFTARFGRPPTLRRLHYELVSDMSATAAGYANTLGDYKRLSNLTARGRREGTFPDLAENARTVTRPRRFRDADELRQYIRNIARVDRMRDQRYMFCAVVEKAGSEQFLHDWFDDYGVFVTALSGYASQTQIDTIRRIQASDGRRMVVLYAGDHDASGEDIDRDFQKRLGRRAIQVRRVALLPEHVEEYNLPISPFDKDDPRAGRFIQQHGDLWQVELDALDPDLLRGLFMDEFEDLWDMSVYEQQLDREADLVREVLGDDDEEDKT